MKQFIYKTIVAIIAIVLVYELTIAKQIKEFTSQSEIILTKEGRKDGVEKIREELKKAIKKERYLSKEDAKLINQFIRKIRNELRESSD
jgi:tRNA C32,U32 (ribose-2'-O)-methylase TrmJ|tara:strand:+ start:944 stop:1210 length:267 start_codon:yes stop_codon:yes gene_type:complete